MKSIIGNQFVKHLNGLKSHIQGFEPVEVPIAVPCETTTSPCFDLMDKRTPNIVAMGEGSVTYHNPDESEINVINYEDFLNSLPDSVAKGLKRPDFIVYDSKEENNFFIINELSQGKPASKRSDAKVQMHSALKLLLEIDESKKIIDSRSKRWCVFSCRTNFPETPEGMADAFGLNGKNLPLRTPIKFQPITKTGFEAFETDVITLKSE